MSGQSRPQAGHDLVGAEHEQRRGGHPRAGGGGVGGHLDLGATGRGQAQQVVEEVLVGGHDEGQARSGHRGSPTRRRADEAPTVAEAGGAAQRRSARLWITRSAVDSRHATG